jgi:uncharacterized membrane protein
MSDPEPIVARLLLVGGVMSIALMLGGLIAFAVHGGADGAALDLQRLLANRAEARSAQTFVSIGDIRRGLAHRPVDPLAVTAAGVVVLLLTPVAGVAGALVAFARAKDRTYATVAGVLLAALLVSFLLGGGG